MAMGLNFLGREKLRGVEAGVVHLLGSILGGALVGLVLGALGSGLELDRWRVWIVGGAAVGVMVVSLTRDHFELGRPCQVPRSWSRSMAANIRFLSWGLMLGSGVATLIPYPAYFLLLAGEATVSPFVAAIAGGLYGLARELPALWVLVHPVGPEKTMDVLPKLRPAWRGLNLFLGAAGSLALILSAV